MKLSEAMRRGSKMGKQAFKRWYTEDNGGCALTATAMGAGLIQNSHYAPIVMSTLIELFPELSKESVCPACKECNFLYGTIMHLNDIHEWTRECIAGWYEATHEVPVYSMLEMLEYMSDPATQLVEVPRV